MDAPAHVRDERRHRQQQKSDDGGTNLATPRWKIVAETITTITPAAAAGTSGGRICVRPGSVRPTAARPRLHRERAETTEPATRSFARPRIAREQHHPAVGKKRRRQQHLEHPEHDVYTVLERASRSSRVEILRRVCGHTMPSVGVRPPSHGLVTTSVSNDGPGDRQSGPTMAREWRQQVSVGSRMRSGGVSQDREKHLPISFSLDSHDRMFRRSRYACAQLDRPQGRGNPREGGSDA